MPVLREAPEIRRALRRCHGFEECILVDVGWERGGETLELGFDYIHGGVAEALSATGTNPVGPRRGALSRPRRVGLRLSLVQEFRLYNGLNDAMLSEPERLDWGWCEIAVIELRNDELLLRHYRESPVPMLHLAVLWEGGKRRLDVVFAGLEIRDHGEAAEQAAAADREARLAPSLHGR